MSSNGPRPKNWISWSCIHSSTPIAASLTHGLDFAHRTGRQAKSRTPLQVLRIGFITI
jgi:hypothetical protein